MQNLRKIEFRNTKGAAVLLTPSIKTPQADYVRRNQPKTMKEPTLRLLALELVLLDVESGLQQVLLFFHVAALETSGDTGAGVSTSIKNVSSVVVLGLVQQRLDTGLCERP